MSDDENTWHGKHYTEWLAMFDETHWREKVAATLREVATTPGAPVTDRLMALQVLNEGIQNKALPADPSYPQLMRDVLLETVTLYQPPVSKLQRKALKARLRAARWMLATTYQIIGYADAAQQVAGRTPALDRLLS